LDELRWILLGLGVLVIGATWLWSARGSRQAPGNSELREPTVTHPHGAGGAPPAPAPLETRASAADKREWGVPPLEPLSIRTADFAEVRALDQPMLTHADPADDEPGAAKPVEDAQADVGVELEIGAQAPAARRSPEQGDRHAIVDPPPADTSERQKIVTVRVCAVGERRWAGADLRNALEALGLAHGRLQVYHRKHDDGRSIFCVASLVEPGTFDLSTMPHEQFRGVSLFAVLPGPLEPMQTVEVLLASARDLARALSGTMQDARGIPLSPQRTEALLRDVARFQTLLA
jgi:FtsZ-interacting cell division protein ZipA